ncbi:DNA repair protein [Vibrio panuliri]|uniref:DNA repair protein n=1 Tax=Vibrio panuliri TaxID=1381081 RepID=A0A1Q9HN99_9VIBR|nr:alpha-ketoglutarate-dependent dioxygenase AlkB [Vibrio panuliri]OLQ92288.1 DNA repair protein [Vibrio panuliri]
MSSNLMWHEVDGGKLLLIKNFLPKAQADTNYQTLLNQTPWQQEAITMFGRRVLQPRLQASYGEHAYQYSGLVLSPKPMPALITQLKEQCEIVCQQPFNTVLLNLYRDGQDYMGWHQDNERELGVNPVIASVSLGAVRKFAIKRKDGSAKLDFHLNHGSLLVMAGELQHHWRHSLPKTKRISEPRINLTFRYIVPEFQ